MVEGHWTLGSIMRSFGGKIDKLDERLFVGFIDCNYLETDRPGGGPCEAESNARRWNVEVQRAYYNGWKSIHGLKHQTRRERTFGC